MKKAAFLIIVVYACGAMGAADSFLSAQPFPKTFDDLSFIDRMQVLAEGYEDYDPEYDENGVCISGCAYKGIKLEDELAAIERNTNAANARLAAYLASHPELTNQPSDTTNTSENNNTTGTGGGAIIPPSTFTNLGTIIGNIGGSGNGTTTSLPQPPTNMGTVLRNGGGNGYGGGNTSVPPATGGGNVKYQCSQHSNMIKPGWEMPAQAPIDGELVITSDFGTRPRPCSGCSANHRGIDLRATTGTNVYSPANGVVTVVKTAASGCGKQIQIKHSDGTISQYCHLSQQLVREGERVQGGCLIGKVGNTGSSTGPHLHYALMVGPQQFIDPLWQENRLGRPYSFKSGANQSKEHQGKKLPGKTN